MTEYFEKVQLSPQGEARREAMRRMLSGAVVAAAQSRRRRRTAFGVMAMAGAVLMLGVINQAPNQRGASTSARIESGRATKLPIQWVNTRSDIMKQYVVQCSDPIERLNDDQLLEEMADLGRPSGLIRIEGRSMLVDHFAVNLPHGADHAWPGLMSR